MKFRSDEITASAAPSGVRGGRAFIEWTATNKKQFTITAIKKFADGHHFTYISDVPVSSAELSGWTTSSGTTIFPLSYNGLDTTVQDDETWAHFPRSIVQDSVVIKFKTNWIIAIGGVEKEAYAYALLTDDQQKLAMYHIWGE